ncbi:MAG: glycosyltransferase family 39 protein [Chloroflexi bacterium]|nr:glycosyltransferase family 39 protein [Chloroflexota bacterium]
MPASRSIKVLTLVTLIFAVLFVTDAFPWLRGDVSWIPLDGRWRWPYEPPDAGQMILPVVGVGIYVAGAVALLRTERTRYLLLWAFGGAVLVPLLVLTIEGNPLFLLFTRSASQYTGGYQYAAAVSPDLGESLQDWPDFMDQFQTETKLDPPGGVALSAPGLFTVYHLTGQTFDAVPPAADQFGSMVRPLQCQNLEMMTWSDADMASAWLQILMPLWAALGIAPLYRLGVALFDRERARLAVALWPLVPGLAIFQPRFNVFYPLMTALMLLWLWRGMDRNRPLWIGLAGAMLSVGLLFNLSLVPLGLLAGFFILGYRLLYQKEPFILAVRDLWAFGAGCLSAWLVLWAVSFQSPYNLVTYALDQHYNMYRPYWPWLIMHPYDMFLFVGLPVAVLAVWRMIQLHQLRSKPVTASDVLVGASALALIILVFSGTARGETGRVWLFFAPVWLLLAADMLAGQRRRERVYVLVLQAVVLICMAAVLRATVTTLTEPPTTESASHPPTFPYNATLVQGDDEITFVGMSVEPTDTHVTLDLHWRAESRIKRPYVLTLVSVRPDGSPGATLEWSPQGWENPYLPSCWEPGQEFIDVVDVSLGEDVMPGNWTFSVRVVDYVTREPMQVVKADGTQDRQIGIGPVTVAGPPPPPEPESQPVAVPSSERSLD